jgi:hypothetical protein
MIKIVMYELEAQKLAFSDKEKKMAEEAYCVKCKQKRQMLDGQKVTMANGRPAMKGKCAVCGTTLFKILPKQTA